MPKNKREIRETEPSEAWLDEPDARKYAEATGDEEADQDDEETLAIQSDARDTVEPHAPALRTRGSSPGRPDADTREDAGVMLDSTQPVDSDDYAPTSRRRQSRGTKPKKRSDRKSH